MSGMVALPTHVLHNASAPAQPLGYVFEHKFDCLSTPVQVFQPYLGPGHPGCISIITRGFCQEIDLWFKMFAAHSEIVFGPQAFRSRPPLTAAMYNNGGQLPLHYPYYTIRRQDSLSICGECARTLSIRSCDGSTKTSHCGCSYHEKHPTVPFAYRRRDIDPPRASFLRNLKGLFWNHQSQVDMYFISHNPITPTGPVHTIIPSQNPHAGHPLGGATVVPSTGLLARPSAPTTPASHDERPTLSITDADPSRLVNVTFLRDYRLVDERARHQRVAYIHSTHCIHGTQPACIIQGTGLKGLFYQQCDGTFANALGEPLSGVSAPLSAHQRRYRRMQRRSRTINTETRNAGTNSERRNTNESDTNDTAITLARNGQPRDFRTHIRFFPRRSQPFPSLPTSNLPSTSVARTHTTGASLPKRSSKNPTPVPSPISSAQAAELAWRAHHPSAGPNTWREVETIRKREAQLKKKETRKQKRREMLPRAEMWVGRKMEGVKGRLFPEGGVLSVVRKGKGMVGEWVWEKTAGGSGVGFWGA